MSFLCSHTITHNKNKNLHTLPDNISEIKAKLKTFCSSFISPLLELWVTLPYSYDPETGDLDLINHFN